MTACSHGRDSNEQHWLHMQMRLAATGYAELAQWEREAIQRQITLPPARNWKPAVQIAALALLLALFGAPAAAATAAGEVAVTVTAPLPPPNKPPVASPGTATTPAGQPVTVTPQVSDPDGDAVTVCSVGTPAHGTATLNPDGTVTYAPAAGFVGSDSFTYTASDRPAEDCVVRPPPAPAPAPAGGRTWIDDPRSVVAMPKPSQPGDVVGLALDNRSTANGSGQVVTFGEVFLAGEVAAGRRLMARTGGQLVPVQMDVKTTYADGSVKHAVLSVAPPVLAGNGAAYLMLTAVGAGGAGPALTASNVLSRNYNLKLEIDLYDGQGVRTIDAASLLSQAIQAGRVEMWLSGPLASEFRIETVVAGDLKAKLDIRLTADGGIKTDVILARDATFVNSSTFMQSITYDATIRSNGSVAAQHLALTHFQNANWHKEVWSGARAQINVVRDVDHMLATGAVPAFDPSLEVSGAVLAALTTGSTAPMGTGTVTTAMPGTGGRPDIGVLPTWSVFWLLSQDSRAYAAMIANADAAGSVPWHFVDEATGEVVRIDQRTGLFISVNQGPGTNQLAKTFKTSNTPWTTDNAHEPSLTYLPYLLTGSRYYLDELQAQTAFDLAAIWPGHRDAPPSRWWEYFPQLRQEAWDLRTLAQTVFITPDSDPMKAYFTSQLDRRLGRLVDIYITRRVTKGAGETEGWFLANYPADGVAPWQEDYMALTLVQLARQGVPRAAELLQWAENYLAGRFLNGDNGYNPLAGVDYWLGVGKPYEGSFAGPTWAAWYAAAKSGGCAPLELGCGFGYPHLALGAAAISRGAMAELFNATGSADALAGYGFVVSQTQNRGMVAEFPKDPTWHMAPRLQDGRTIAVGDIQVAAGAAPVTLTGGPRPSLLYGGPGGDTLACGTGPCVLFGGDGNDALKGGPGADWLYGGKGDDRLEGGPGADTFVFDKINAGRDTVVDFKPGTDRIVFGTANAANKGLTAAGLLSGATVDAGGNVVLHPGAGSDITLVGVRPGELSAGDIVIGR